MWGAVGGVLVNFILWLHRKKDYKMVNKRGAERNVVKNMKMREKKECTNNL
jgi:hypothetical protein